MRRPTQTIEKARKGRQTLSVTEYLDLRDMERMEEVRLDDLEGREEPALTPMRAPLSLWDDDEAAKVYPVRITYAY